MFAVTIDQRGSQTHSDQVPGLLRLLAEVDACLPFERTAGDEVQGLLCDADAVIDAIERTMRSPDWSIGVGIGPVELPLPTSVRAARGPALVRAREAVEDAKKSTPVKLALHAGVPDARGSEIEALMRVVGVVLQRRKPAQWRVIDAVRQAADRAAAAAALGITVQAVSKSLLTSSEDVVLDVYPLLARLLSEADERSE
ncbi:hypothetical protein [Blastococcus sp. Marseille-P5729]|uniref:hypothetical protein n=1 Tax=Blastococcus sp. Marseille-P5729 TaxID=2086582 RepID=UPI000D0EA204|nr:hypothetical protein [Blastococcus sp. Marseille-P5729]